MTRPFKPNKQTKQKTVGGSPIAKGCQRALKVGVGDMYVLAGFFWVVVKNKTPGHRLPSRQEVSRVEAGLHYKDKTPFLAELPAVRDTQALYRPVAPPSPHGNLGPAHACRDRQLFSGIENCGMGKPPKAKQD